MVREAPKKTCMFQLISGGNHLVSGAHQIISRAHHLVSGAHHIITETCMSL